MIALIAVSRRAFAIAKGTHKRAATVRLEAPGVVAYADGEYVAPLPVDISCVARAVEVLVPGR